MSSDPGLDLGVGEVCIPNISTRERRKRLASGVVSLVLAVVILAVLLASGASQWWRLVLFPLFFSAASGFFQWRDKT
jgi:hypothetical protein